MTSSDFCRWCGNVIQRGSLSPWRHVRPDYAEGCTWAEPRDRAVLAADRSE